MSGTLNDHPDFVYLLREFETLYRHGSAGGSTAIRGHRKRVRDVLSRIFAANPPFDPRAARDPRDADLGIRL